MRRATRLPAPCSGPVNSAQRLTHQQLAAHTRQHDGGLDRLEHSRQSRRRKHVPRLRRHSSRSGRRLNSQCVPGLARRRRSTPGHPAFGIITSSRIKDGRACQRHAGRHHRHWLDLDAIAGARRSEPWIPRSSPAGRSIARPRRFVERRRGVCSEGLAGLVPRQEGHLTTPRPAGVDTGRRAADPAAVCIQCSSIDSRSLATDDP